LHTATHCNTLQHTATHVYLILNRCLHTGSLRGPSSVSQRPRHQKCVANILVRKTSVVTHSTVVCCSVFSVLQCVAVCCRGHAIKNASPTFLFGKFPLSLTALWCVAVSCSELQCIAVCCRVLQCVAVCCSVVLSHCNTLQHTATHCNTLQHTATHCNTLQHACTLKYLWQYSAMQLIYTIMSCCSTLQHTATHCNTLQHVATRAHTHTHGSTQQCN